MSRDLKLSLISNILESLEQEPIILADKDVAQFFRQKTLRKDPSNVILNPAPVQTETIVFSPKIEPKTIQTPTPPSLPLEKPTPEPIFKPLEKIQDSKTIEKEDFRSSAALSNEILDIASMKAIFEKIFPNIPLLFTLPSDLDAKKIASSWKTKNKIAPISIISFGEPKEQKILLQQIATAIDVYFGSCKLVEAEAIEKDKQWQSFLDSSDLKWIIICDYSLWQLSHLMSFFKENPSQQTRMLGKTPVFLLSDLSLYMKDPSLKRSLWKALCMRLSS